MADINKMQAHNIDSMLRELRKQGVTAQTVASMVKVDAVTVSRWRSGTNRITNEHAKAISRHFPEYSVAYITGYSKHKSNKEESFSLAADAARNIVSEHQAVRALVGCCGYEIQFPDENGSEQNEDNETVTLTKNGESESLPWAQWADFVDDVRSYTKLRIEKVVERGAW